MSPWAWARRYAEKPERRVVGLMSGTSVDGIDAALMRIRGSGRDTRIALDAFVTVPFEDDTRREILEISHGTGGAHNAETISRLNARLGERFAEAVRAATAAAGLPADAPPPLDLVASHGQTISHTPPGATLQIGEPAVIAQRLGVPVVSDFRAADVAVGGQGAPLVPYADWCLLTHPRKTRAVQNLGGIANVTFLPANGGRDEVVGFDTGPGNMLIDRAAAWATGGEQHFDRDGLLAAQGQVRPDLMALLLDHPFLRTTPPKSSGREAFGEPLFRELLPAITGVRGADVVATMTEFTARTVADAYRRFLPRRPDEVIVGGGGARNPTLMGRLRAALDPTPVLTHEDVGMHGDAKEAIAFALLANETLLGNPGNLPSVTGASRPVLLGKLTLP